MPTGAEDTHTQTLFHEDIHTPVGILVCPVFNNGLENAAERLQSRGSEPYGRIPMKIQKKSQPWCILHRNIMDVHVAVCRGRVLALMPTRVTALTYQLAILDIDYAYANASDYFQIMHRKT